MGLDPKAFTKLHSFLVTAEAACSRGDLPVVTEEVRLVAVTGFATAAETTEVPAELATAVLELPRAAKGAMQAVSMKYERVIKSQVNTLGCIAR